MTWFDTIPDYKVHVQLRNEIDRNNEIIYNTVDLVRNKCRLTILSPVWLPFKGVPWKVVQKSINIFPNWFVILSWDCLLPSSSTSHLSTSLLVTSAERLQSPIRAFRSPATIIYECLHFHKDSGGNLPNDGCYSLCRIVYSKGFDMVAHIKKQTVNLYLYPVGLCTIWNKSYYHNRTRHT